jgi:hypothetical protein
MGAPPGLAEHRPAAATKITKGNESRKVAEKYTACLLKERGNYRKKEALKSSRIGQSWAALL